MMPRRAFLASSAAAFAAPVAIAAPVIAPASDAVFAAIAAFRQAEAAWQQSLEACEAADRALQAEDAFPFARIRVPIAGKEIEMRTHEDISKFIHALRDSCRASDIAWDDAAMAGVAQGMRKELDAERERVELARSKVNADVLEARQETAYMAVARTAEAALATIPTTLAGLQAFADLVAEMGAQPGRFLDHHEDSSLGLATLATACRNLLPAA